MKMRKFTFNYFEETTYVLSSEAGKCILVDPGFTSPAEMESLFSFLDSEGLKVGAVLVTHGHYDHTAGISETVKKYGCPVYLSHRDSPVLKYNLRLCGIMSLDAPVYDFEYRDVKDGDRISVCGFDFKAIATPGHTPGSVCYLEQEKNFILTGDTLFAGTIGRTDLEYGEYDDIIVSVMDKLMILDGGLTVYPGHGPETTIAYERLNNPFLEPWGGKEESGTENPQQFD